MGIGCGFDLAVELVLQFVPVFAVEIGIVIVVSDQLPGPVVNIHRLGAMSGSREADGACRHQGEHENTNYALPLAHRIHRREYVMNRVL